mmetsp:Transcript_3438/g.10301  ORF Transcript_3438/g.10301 Transcript_3438/m.10301 type:complete len:272 (-) Transcript_3438:428-1243(-)
MWADETDLARPGLHDRGEQLHLARAHHVPDILRGEHHLHGVEAVELRRQPLRLDLAAGGGEGGIFLNLPDGTLRRDHDVFEHRTDGRARQVVPAQLFDGRRHDGRAALDEHEQHRRLPTHDGVLDGGVGGALLEARDGAEHALHDQPARLNVEQVLDRDARLRAAEHDCARRRRALKAARSAVVPPAGAEAVVALPQHRDDSPRPLGHGGVLHIVDQRVVGIAPAVHRQVALAERLELRVLAEPLDLAGEDVVDGADELQLLHLDAGVHDV